MSEFDVSEDKIEGSAGIFAECETAKRYLYRRIVGELNQSTWAVFRPR